MYNYVMLDNSNNYAWVRNCPVCSQGRVIIAKETATEKFYLVCEECESEWQSPEEVATSPASRDVFGASTYLTREELGDHPWKEFLHN